VKSWITSALALGLLLAASAAQASDVGKPAHDFSLTTLDKQEVTLAGLKGKVVVVNRWATWCTPCKAEMVAFENYLRTHPGTDLKIYAVTVELQFPSSKLKPLQGVLSFPLATSISGASYRVKEGVPTSYVIDRAGTLRYAASGAFDLEGFDALVTPLLKEPAPDARPAASATSAAR
jgi:thiol-disulfide isomerase/thioredoxin